MAYPTDYFEANRFVLQFGGMWVPEKARNYAIWCAFLCYNAFCIFYCEILFFPTEAAKLQHTYANLDQVVEHVGMLITHLIGTVKVISFYWKRAKVHELMRVLEAREFHYENCDEYAPGVFFENAKVLNSRVTYGFFIAASLVPVSNYISAGFAFHKAAAEFRAGNVTCDDILPYFNFIPFFDDERRCVRRGPFYQSIPMTVYAWQIAAHDTLFSSILTYAKAHLQSLRGAFETMRPRCLRRLGLAADHQMEPHDLHIEMKTEMKKCTRHLQTVIWTVESIEDIFNFVTLGQVLVTLFVLVSCLFMVSSVPILSGTFAAEVVYLTAITYQFGLYAWFGNEITLAGSNIPTAMYFSDWLSATPEFKKSMLINMLRMRKPLVVTVGKFTPLTLTTLVSIMRGSYSYFAVLKNSKSK